MTKRGAGTRGRRWARRAISGAAVLALIYAALLGLSVMSLDDRDRVAALGELGAAIPVETTAPGAARLGEALGAVRDARRSTLGLFPTYDPVRLGRAADSLGALARDVEASPWVGQEAQMARGRALVVLGRDAQAARVLGALVGGGGYRAPAARRLLDHLRAGPEPVPGR